MKDMNVKHRADTSQEEELMEGLKESKCDYVYL
jgi:hypothetical protein